MPAKAKDRNKEKSKLDNMKLKKINGLLLSKVMNGKAKPKKSEY